MTEAQHDLKKKNLEEAEKTVISDLVLGLYFISAAFHFRKKNEKMKLTFLAPPEEHGRPCVSEQLEDVSAVQHLRFCVLTCLSLEGMRINWKYFIQVRSHVCSAVNPSCCRLGARVSAAALWYLTCRRKNNASLDLFEVKTEMKWMVCRSREAPNSK